MSKNPEAIEIASRHLDHVVSGPEMNYMVHNAKGMTGGQTLVEFEIWKRGEDARLYQVRVSKTNNVIESDWK